MNSFLMCMMYVMCTNAMMAVVVRDSGVKSALLQLPSAPSPWKRNNGEAERQTRQQPKRFSEHGSKSNRGRTPKINIATTKKLHSSRSWTVTAIVDRRRSSKTALVLVISSPKRENDLPICLHIYIERKKWRKAFLQTQRTPTDIVLLKY